jgi:hypothetical protein
VSKNIERYITAECCWGWIILPPPGKKQRLAFLRHAKTQRSLIKLLASGTGIAFALIREHNAIGREQILRFWLRHRRRATRSLFTCLASSG